MHMCFQLFQAPYPSVQRPPSRVVRRRPPCKNYTKDVVCLPFSLASVFRIPRGESRVSLAQKGLMGKVSFTSESSEAELREEVTAIFRRTFALPMGQSFQYQYLNTVKGCKRLMKPAHSKCVQLFHVGRERGCVHQFSNMPLYNGIDTYP